MPLRSSSACRKLLPEQRPRARVIRPARMRRPSYVTTGASRALSGLRGGLGCARDDRFEDQRERYTAPPVNPERSCRYPIPSWGIRRLPWSYWHLDLSGVGLTLMKPASLRALHERLAVVTPVSVVLVHVTGSNLDRYLWLHGVAPCVFDGRISTVKLRSEMRPLASMPRTLRV